MQKNHHLLRLSKGVLVETTIYFVVWWALLEYSAVLIDHFPNDTCVATVSQRHHCSDMQMTLSTTILK